MRIEKSKIATAIKLLCESSGIRQTSRIVGIHQDTVLRILKISGTIAGRFMKEKATNLKCAVVAADEVHSYVNTREINLRDKVFGKGTHFTFFAVDQASKFIISTVTDERTTRAAESLLKTLKSRVGGRFPVEYRCLVRVLGKRWGQECGEECIRRRDRPCDGREDIL